MSEVLVPGVDAHVPGAFVHARGDVDRPRLGDGLNALEDRVERILLGPVLVTVVRAVHVDARAELA